MIVVRRQEINPEPGRAVIFVGSGAKLLHLQVRPDGSLHLYYEVDHEKRDVLRNLMVVATGEEVPFGGTYVATFYVQSKDTVSGFVVGHLYDLGEG